jgi:AGZA family xanthine/uracil permease-like MFS transporter
MGTSTSGAFIESATGIREGARTGLAAVTVAVLFALSLFFLPLFGPLQEMKYAYAPALLIVGMLMLPAAARINYDDLTEAAPAFVTIVMMLFTYNIANGLTAGLAIYPLIKLAAGRYHELNTGSAALGVLCLVYYARGMPH